MKKGIIIGIIIGLVIGFGLGIIIARSIDGNHSSNNNKNENETSTLNEYDQKFIGKWEYGTKYEDIEPKLNKKLNEAKEKHNLESGQYGCVYSTGNNSFNSVYAEENNKTLIINKDGTVEYIAYYGVINDSCEVQVVTSTHYKGTFENSKIVFKESESNGEWKEIRETHNIYLEDSETLHYKVNDENANSATCLFIKRK